ncbi:hypothetical protein [Nocardia flavorosea]|uniref:Uncharacterized protein n=1 Tax=Nocardia flavorosea TaxID=53429 RepID=A0A846YPF3_9NOCA|nr:hypothetical protein [Nocardia flavorosea]NKY59208.1 hypothetical protein [Nocardia flavorosea]
MFGSTGHPPAGPGTRRYTVVRPGAPAGAGGLIDVDGHAYAAHDAVDGTRILVRPDGYLGATPAA